MWLGSFVLMVGLLVRSRSVPHTRTGDRRTVMPAAVIVGLSKGANP
jgi:hypothetical protein